MKFSVVLNDVELAREAFQRKGEVTSGRPYNYFVEKMSGAKNGVFYGTFGVREFIQYC